MPHSRIVFSDRLLLPVPMMMTMMMMIIIILIIIIIFMMWWCWCWWRRLCRGAGMLLYSPAEARICLCLDLMLVTGEAVYSIKKSVPHKSCLTRINNHTVNSDYPMCITCVAWWLYHSTGYGVNRYLCCRAGRSAQMTGNLKYSHLKVQAELLGWMKGQKPADNNDDILALLAY